MNNPQTPGEQVGGGAGSGSLGGWRHGKRSVVPHSSENGLAGCCCCSAEAPHHLSVLAPLARDAESYESMCLLKLGPQVHPWEGSVHCRFSKEKQVPVLIFSADLYCWRRDNYLWKSG